MATSAVAREAVAALRHQIAKIEGRLPERLATPSSPAGEVVLRANGAISRDAVGRSAARGGPGAVIASGAAGLDEALGGGLPMGALTEIHARGMRDAGPATGFVLAMASRALGLGGGSRPLLVWIGLTDALGEAGFPHAPGVSALFGIEPDGLLICEAARLPDALWVAEEAARLDEPGAIVLELRGNPKMLDLTATRRLHRRAMEAGRPFFLLRHSARAEPTAAPVRLLVSPARAGLRPTLSGPLAGSIGPPAFTVEIGKSRTARPGQFELEWNPHDRSLWQRRPEIPRALVPLSGHGEDLAPASGPRLAHRSG